MNFLTALLILLVVIHTLLMYYRDSKNHIKCLDKEIELNRQVIDSLDCSQKSQGKVVNLLELFDELIEEGKLENVDTVPRVNKALNK